VSAESREPATLEKRVKTRVCPPGLKEVGARDVDRAHHVVAVHVDLNIGRRGILIVP
jgi:hypothetical protein